MAEEVTLDRLANGIKRANEAGNKEQVQRLGQAYRALQSQQGGGQSSNQQPDQARNGAFEGWGQAFTQAVDAPLEQMGTTADALGFDGTADSLRGAVDQTEGYESASEQFMGNDEDGLDWSYLPKATVEQAGQFAGSIASRAGGTALGAGIGSMAGPAGTAIGATAGAFAGPAVFEGVQILGPTALERARNNGREEPNAEDWSAAFATASASGALNSLAPGVQGTLRRMLVEGGTEGVQSVTQQTGETAGTDEGWEVSSREALGEGILGGTSAGAVDGTVAGARAVANADPSSVIPSRYDSGFDADDRRLAERFRNHASGDDSRLANVSSTDAETSAQGLAIGVNSGIKNEMNNRASRLKKLARDQQDNDALDIISRVLGPAQNRTSGGSENDRQALLDKFGHTKEGQEFVSLAKQASKVQGFTQSLGDLGGFGFYTRYSDILDGRNQGITRGILMGGGAIGGGLVSVGGTAGAALAGTGINRAARMVDNATNKRSKVKRYVESVERENPEAGPLDGIEVQALLDQSKRRRDQEKETKRRTGKAMQNLAKNPAKFLKDPNAKAQPAQQANQQAQAENLASEYTPSARATEAIFEEGSEIPDTPYFDPYKRWQEATGLPPSETLPVIEQLEREGAVPQNTAQRFREDIRSFETKKGRKGTSLTYDTQELVRQRANPDYVPQRRGKGGSDPDQVLNRMNLNKQRVPGDRRKEKAIKGAVHRRNVDADIQNSEKALNTKQLLALKNLAEEIDSPAITRAERHKMVNRTLGTSLFNPVERDHWKRKFSDLATVGNDRAIEREAEQSPGEQEFEQKVEKAKQAKTKKSKKKKKNKRKGPSVAVTEYPTPTPIQPEKVPQEVDFSRKANPQQNDQEATLDQSKVSRDDDAKKLPVPEKRNNRKGSNKNALKTMVENRVDSKRISRVTAANEANRLDEFLGSLGKGAEDRVVDIIVSSGNSQLNQNMITDAYRQRHNVPSHQDAARIVNDVMEKLEGKGALKRYRKFKASTLKENGKIKKDQEGNTLQVVSFDLVDPNLTEMRDIAKAVNEMAKVVDPNDPPQVLYDPQTLTNGVHKALKSYDQSEIDDNWQPFFDFQNSLRDSVMKVNNRMLTQVEDAMSQGSQSKVGSIADVLRPSIGTNSNGKPIRDDTNLNTVAQMLFTYGEGQDRAETPLRQEWSADKNLRVYPSNGLAHTQAGDIMKGMVRTEERHPLGGEQGLDMVFHSIGNLLGADKEAPADRRNMIFRNPKTVDTLINFADKPFGVNKLTRDGKPTEIGKLVNDGEGFFQVLNAAHEVKDMTDFAKARFPNKGKMKPAELLQDPEVRQDLAANYETDFMAQLDASNNAYQLAGLTMGYGDVLQATGMQPQQGVTDPDQTKGADIYLDPARDIAQRIPELANLNLPDSKLRKLFKGAIGTYLYEAEFASRKEGFKDQLETIANGADIFGIDGDGLISIPEDVVSRMQSDEGVIMDTQSYDQFGREKETKRSRKRVVQNDKGGYSVESASGNTGEFNRSVVSFQTPEEAIKEAYGNAFYAKMNQELIRDMNTRYPKMREYLNFAQKVTQLAKDRGEDHVKIPTPDGMVLKSRFKEDTQYDRFDVELGDGKVVPMGVQTPDHKLTGRGVAAAMMHQLDAYVLRETHRRMKEQGLLEKGFNPIHDSYGFHPSEAEQGRKVWAEVMQELGDENYNLFHQVMEANGISLGEMEGNIPERQGVQPVPASQIPTALS